MIHIALLRNHAKDKAIYVTGAISRRNAAARPAMPERPNLRLIPKTF